MEGRSLVTYGCILLLIAGSTVPLSATLLEPQGPGIGGTPLGSPDDGAMGDRASAGPATSPEGFGCVDAVDEAFKGLDGSFFENKGQMVDAGVRFYLKAPSATILLGDGGLELHGEAIEEGGAREAPVRIEFQGANDVRPSGVDPVSRSTNFYIGSDAAGWVSGVSTYRSVQYDGLWDGVGLRLYCSDSRLKYEFIVGPGGSPDSIRMAYSGVDGLRVSQETGELLIATGEGILRDSAPYSYQFLGGRQVVVPTVFSLSDAGTVGFDVGIYDARADLVIDPGLEFSSFFGGSSTERYYGERMMDVGKDGSIYVSAVTGSVDLPTTPGAFCSTNSGGTWDGFVARLSSDASELVYCTYFGGAGQDNVQGVRLDGEGNAILVGYTQSVDFPVTPGAYCSTCRKWDGFLMKFNSTGGLVWSSLFGGADDDYFQDLDVDAVGDVYISGTTVSADFPTTSGAFCTTHNGNYDFLLLKYSLALNSIVYSTYIGGPDSDGVSSAPMAVDSAGCVVLGGWTLSMGFPVTDGTYCATLPSGGGGILLKLKSDGSGLAFSTYTVGGSEKYVELDGDGGVWVCGDTTSTALPVTSDAFQRTLDGTESDGWFAKFSADGSNLSYCSYFGGKGQDRLESMDLDEGGDPVLYLTTGSDDLTTPLGSYDSSFSSICDVFIARIDLENRSLINATYLGGSAIPYGDQAHPGGLRYMGGGRVIVVGDTLSDDFPTTAGAFDRTHEMLDIFVASLEMGMTPWRVTSAPTSLCATCGDGTIGLSWHAPIDSGGWPIQFYRVYIDMAPGPANLYATVYGSTSYTCTGLTNGETYNFSVSAVTVVGEGDRSTSVGGTPFGVPSPPMNVTLEAGDGNVSITWDPPVDDGGITILGYRILRGVVENALQPILEVGDATHHLDSGLTNGEEYFYQVQAYHEYADGSPSSVKSATPRGRPSEPLALRAVGGDRQVGLSWSAPLADGGSPIQSYRLYRGASEEGMVALALLEPSLSFMDVGLFNGARYYYALSALNGIGEGTRTPVVSAVPIGPPGPPEDQSIEEGDRQVRVRWSPPTDTGGAPILGYRIYRGISPDSLALVADLGNVTELTDTGLVNGVAYHYQVRARTVAGEGTHSVVLVGTPAGAPSRPIGLSAIPGDGRVELTWIAPEDNGGLPILQYAVLRGPDASSLATIKDIGATGTGWTDVSVANGATYYYAVQAANSRFAGAITEAVEARPFGPPGVPLNFTVELGEVGLLLAWDPPADDGGRAVTRFNLYRGPSMETQLLYRELGRTTTFVDDRVEKGGLYSYSVAAVNEGGAGAAVGSPPMRFMTRPGAVSDLNCIASGTSAVASWSAPADDGGGAIIGYLVLRGDSTDNLTVLESLGAVRTWVDTSVAAGSTYYYCVVALNDLGEGPRSSVVEMRIAPSAKTSARTFSPLLPLLVLCASVIAGIGGAAATESGRYRFALISLSFMSKASKEEILDNKCRYLIYGIIVDRPGIHFNAIMNELGLSAGVTAYHLDVLEEEHYISAVRDGRLKRFYSVGAKVPDAPRLTPEEIKDAIHGLIQARPGISQKEIIDELGIDREIVGYHLRELVKRGEIKDSRKGKYTVYHNGAWKPDG